MKGWLILLIVFVIALTTFGRIECVDYALSRPSQRIAAEFRTADLFQRYYQAAAILDQTADW